MQTEIPMSPRARIRSMIEEVVWWHATLDASPMHLAVTYEEVMSPSRRQRAVTVRYDAMRRVRESIPGISFPHLGRIFRRDHSTVMSAFYTEKYRARRREHSARKRAAQVAHFGVAAE